jgi:hypothetical protein
MIEELSTYVPQQAERRSDGFERRRPAISKLGPGVTLVCAGCWLLYRNLVHGDFISGWIVLLSVALIATGCLVLPTARTQEVWLKKGR